MSNNAISKKDLTAKAQSTQSFFTKTVMLSQPSPELVEGAVGFDRLSQLFSRESNSPNGTTTRIKIRRTNLSLSYNSYFQERESETIVLDSGFSLRYVGIIIGLMLTIFLTAACQTQPNQVFVEADGVRQAITTEAETVREVLDEVSIKLGPLDRVKPDLYAQLELGLTITVTRVKEDIETEREIIPFERQTVINEALAAGQTRLAQLGANGADEVTIRVVYEDGQEVSRTEVSRITVTPPIPEILVIGPQDSLPSVQVEGTIAYISSGNAWIMRNSSSSRRALTTEGKLDNQVFDLSPDSRYLIYTTELTNEIELPINRMWLASTTIVGEPPITTGIEGVLHAEWSPVISPALIAYTTAARTPNPPGWQANNDLWLVGPPAPPSPTAENDDENDNAENEDEPAEAPQPVQIIPSNTEGLYPWWGTTFAWSPDGSRLAYARADQIGVVTLITSSNTLSGSLTPLVDFTPLKTFSDWVWVPGLSWSPDGEFIAATVHGPPLAAEPAEESQAFDLWLLSADGEFSARVAEQVGMWANPSWGEAGIAYGQAIAPFQSVNSRYTIRVMDRDGSNQQQIFPFQDEPGVQFPELVWSPDEQELLFIFNGNLYITSRNGGVPKQLSTDGQSNRPQWGLPAAVITNTVAISVEESEIATDTQKLSTPTPAASSTPESKTTPTPRPTRTSTPDNGN